MDEFRLATLLIPRFKLNYNHKDLSTFSLQSPGILSSGILSTVHEGTDAAAELHLPRSEPQRCLLLTRFESEPRLVPTSEEL